MAKSELRTYKRKRDLKTSPEPKPVKKSSKKKNLFCIQKHHASHLHYDLRIESDGVLKSWAVPKGPSMDPSVKRLAIAVEDHPLHYATFEGIIPSGYGAGTVIVWDIGTYKNVTTYQGKKITFEKAYANGHIEVEFDGQKLQGKFALMRMGTPKNWLLIKMRDEHADAKYDPVATEVKSVLSDATIAKLDKQFKALKQEMEDGDA